ncbi:MAG: hypothetical protein ACRC7N_14630 [Clostridium sp.]
MKNKKNIIIIVVICTVGLFGFLKMDVESKKAAAAKKQAELKKQEQLQLEEKKKQEEEAKKQEKDNKKQENSKFIEDNSQAIDSLMGDIENRFDNIIEIYAHPTSSGISISSRINVLDNITATYAMASELVVKFESRLKQIKVNSITISIYNGEEHMGMLIFNLDNGIYKPTINTVR